MAEYIERDGLEFPYMTMTLWGLNQETCHAYNEGIKAAADYIASIPAADVAPVRHGRWIDYVWRPKCSLCGFSGSLYDTPKHPFNYCPNCGAKMDLEGGDG